MEKGKSKIYKSYKTQDKFEIYQFAKVNVNRATERKFNIGKPVLREWQKNKLIDKKLHGWKQSMSYLECVVKKFKIWLFFKDLKE